MSRAPSDPFFSLGVRSTETGTVVSVAGELDVATAPALARALAGADGEVVVDLKATTFADPSTLGVLLAARAARRTMRVDRRSGGAVARLLALTGTDRLLAGSEDRRTYTRSLRSV
ncbi:MAG TPA: STAS domain-containing protein [Solirubrobacteraceae bacterium]